MPFSCGERAQCGGRSFLGSSGGGGLGHDNRRNFVSNELSALVRAGSLASNTHSLLLLGGVASLEHLHHLALERRQAGDFIHDFADGLNARVQAALALRLRLSESVGVGLGLCHDVTLVQTDKNSTLLHHLISFKIINTTSASLLLPISILQTVLINTY